MCILIMWCLSSDKCGLSLSSASVQCKVALKGDFTVGPRTPSLVGLGCASRGYHRLEMIVAMNPEGLIATSKGRIPWNVPEDMEHFRKTTADSIVIMGRNTWESLPVKSRPLAGRINIIMTREPLFKQVIELQQYGENTHVVTGMADLWGLLDQLDTAARPRRIFIIGGAQIYRHFMPICEKLYLTEVNFTDDIVGGTYFPLNIASFDDIKSGWVPVISPKEWSISHKAPFLCYRMWEFIASDAVK